MITAAKIVSMLNDAIALDSNVLYALCENRTMCNPEFANHPTIQVMSGEKVSADWCVGMLGILNGIAAMENKKIVAVYNDADTTILRFELEEMKNGQGDSPCVQSGHGPELREATAEVEGHVPEQGDGVEEYRAG